MSTAKIHEEPSGRLRVESPYSKDYVKAARDMGGKWSGEEWVFEGVERADVEALVRKYFVLAEDTRPIRVRATVRHTSEDRENLFIGKVPILRGYGRDSGATVLDGVKKFKGKIGSGGSRKNWDVFADAGCEFEIQWPVGEELPDGWEPVVRQRDRTDERIAQIEQQIMALKAELQQLRGREKGSEGALER